MLALGIWLVAVGLCDLLRATRDVTTLRRRLLVVAVGLSILLVLGVLVGLDGLEWVVVYGGWAAALAAWVLGSSAALTHHPSGAPRTVAVAGLVAGLVVGVLGEGALDTPSWPPLLEGSALVRLAPGEVLLVAGVLLAQLATANVFVRLLLDAVGVPATTNEKTLKGGRVLGPMERLFVIGLGMAGSVTAAAIVVAAKGLLRFPELQRGERTGPSDVTEYFLIGSFASWLVALGGLALATLGTP